MALIENGSWTRKLSGYEDLMCKCYDRGFMRIRYILVLNSKAPLRPEDVTSALVHLFRKVPTLRLHYGKRTDDELWFKEMTKETIDFKMVDECSYVTEQENTLHYEFNVSEGPLWCIRMAPSSAKCPMPEIKNDFAYQYNFLFCFHHSITDGMSNVAICNLFLNLLNDVIAEKEIDDTPQLGYHAGEEDEWQEIESRVEQEMVEQTARFTDVQAYFEEWEKASNILRSLFSFTDEESTTDCIHYDFDCEQTKKMIVVSRSHGVTLNSFMSTIISTSVIDIVKKEMAGEVQHEYIIPNGQLVNKRRYLKSLDRITLGCFAFPTQIITKVRSDIRETFWEHAKHFDKDIKNRLNNFAPFEQEVYHKLEDAEGTIDPFLNDDPHELHKLIFATSNLGNLSRTFPGTGEHVQATYINRMTLIQKIYSVHEMHTFRGRLLYSLDYNPMYLPKEKAQSWIDIIVKIINEKLDE